MPTLSTILLFVAATMALLVFPGPAVLYIVTRSVSQGRAAGLVSVLGVHTGTIFFVLATSFGLSALLEASETAFQVVKYLGVAYLVWLGVQKLWLSRGNEDDAAEPPRASLRRIFTQGVIVNLLNPKTLIFFAAFLPQFVDPALGSVTFQLVFFGVGFILLGIVSDGTYALLSSAIAGRLRRTARARRRLDRSSGVVYLLLGAFAATVRQA
ncbi:LysE family translocator [Kutzneria kofuensis]|uniref:Threonine/homoserine/homoserine lactone efflux protein n=1 Tax=Kutzneria kofuensis TaxID=103725 RepID=A0A7W9NE73_9PSEU|nr:LysE family translocator [Kutzneria kofuensis]MBB5889385.1 threonine/homoserine/homoserine lactone efflux protein [Kutzneria kofuensis]